MSCDTGEVTEELILQAFRRSATSQLILQSFPRFTYATAHSPTHLSLLLRHRLFIYVTWRAAYDTGRSFHLYKALTIIRLCYGWLVCCYTVKLEGGT